MSRPTPYADRPVRPHPPRAARNNLPTTRALTPAQRKVLRFIRDCVAARGYPPTLPEIGVAIDVRSPNGVVCHLDALIARGLIEVAGRSSRAIRLVGAAWALHFADDEAGRRLALALEGKVPPQ